MGNTEVSFVLPSESISRSATLFDPMDCSPPGSSVHGVSRQEYWSGLRFPSPGDLPNPGIKPGSPALKADPLPSEPPGKPSILPMGFSEGSDRYPFRTRQRWDVACLLQHSRLCPH